MSIEEIGWQREPVRSAWSALHLTSDGKQTLCGVRIPEAWECFQYGDSGQALCRRCVKARESSQ